MGNASGHGYTLLFLFIKVSLSTVESDLSLFEEEEVAREGGGWLLGDTNYWSPTLKEDLTTAKGCASSRPSRQQAKSVNAATLGRGG